MKLKISTFNIRFENETDGVHIWKNRLPLIQKFIADNQFDILGTQEGREKQIRSLSENVGLSIVDRHRSWINERMYPTLFYNSEKFLLIESNDVWLSNTPQIAGSSSFGSAFPRLATWSKLEQHIGRKRFLVVNVHLDHLLSNTRFEQVKVLINEIKKINTELLPLILIGDFNDSPNDLVHSTICENLNLHDQWILNKNIEETSYHGFKGFDENGSRIDWILSTNEFKCEEIYLAKNQYNGIYLSDHFPVVATLIPN